MLETHSKFHVLDEEPGVYTFAAHRNVNILAWVGRATGAITDRIHTIVERQVREEPNGLSTVHVMTPLAAPPTLEARQGFAQTAKRFESSIVSVSLVVEHEGFWGSTMRSAVTAVLMLLQRTNFPVKVHGSVTETCAWMPAHHLARSGVTLLPGEFLEALEGVRSYTLQKAPVANDVPADLSRSA